ncbi:MAG: hypothetical protein KJ041_05275, partial [Gammaproteobacteria bacterium]|nr:hypothetical protein [Gammaproteobacteria bacterium]
PSAIAGEIVKQYGVRVVGRTTTLHARFYVLSMERRIRHPAVMAITEQARAGLFRERAVAAFTGTETPAGSPRSAGRG